MARKKKARKPFRPNPYMLLTGAVAGTLVAALGGSDAVGEHATLWEESNYLLGVTPGGGSGKMYSDKEPGRPCAIQQPPLTEPDLSTCYMNLLVDRSYGANASDYDAGIRDGLTKWNVTPTTIFFDEEAYSYSVNDVHIKTEDLDWLSTGHRAATWLYDYHNLSNEHYCRLGDCNDPDGLVEHQPQRWCYAYVKLDTTGDARFLGYDADTQSAVIAQELGHVLGLDDRPADDNCSPAPSIMDSKCIQDHGVRNPQPIDTCMVNHAGWPVSPLMYGDAFDSQGVSLAYWTCSGGVP